MSSIGSSTATGIVPGSALQPQTATSSPTIPVLPTPTSGVDGTQDALARLYAMLAQLQTTHAQGAKNDITVNQALRQNAQRARDEALAKAKREAEKGGLFDWICKDIGLLGVAGLATFNYGLVAADLALHKSGAVQNLKLDILDAGLVAYGRPEIIAANVLLRKLEIAPDEIEKKLDELGLGKSVPGISDEDVKPIVDKAVMANLFVLGTAASVLTAGSTTAIVIACVGLALSSGATVVQAAGGPEWLAVGMQIGGLACSLSSAAATGGTAQVVAGQIAKGVSDGLSGVDTIVRTIHQHAADKALYRATEVRHTLQRLERLLDGIIEGLQEGQESHKRTSSILQQTLQTHNQTLVLASSMKG
jgi:hypothetical protein